MTNNLVPPFIMREAGVIVNEVPKIQTKDPDISHHSLFFPKEEVRIPLMLWGIFSYFPTRSPTVQDLIDFEDHLLALTPEGHWNPHSDSYARNEENMLDWEGNIIAPKDRAQIMLEDIPIDDGLVASMSISAVESQICNDICDNSEALDHYMPTNENDIPMEVDELNGQLYKVNPVLDPFSLGALLAERRHVGNFGASIGSTTGWDNEIPFPDFPNSDVKEVDQIDLDDNMACSTEATKFAGVSPEHLSKVWRIDHKTAQRTLDVTTQKCVRSEGNALSRNYSTNDRMLRYKRIHQYFFTDTFFATSKARKSSRGNSCMQLFVYRQRLCVCGANAKLQ